MIDHYYANLTLSDMKDIYQQTHNLDIIDVVYTRYGISGLVQIDIGYAVSMVSTLLEKDVDTIYYYLHTFDPVNLDILLSLLFDVFINTQLNIDTRFENMMKIIKHLRFNHEIVKSRSIIRKFIINVLSYINNNEIVEEHRMDPIDMYQVYVAILENNSISEDDLVTWLSGFPEIMSVYIQKYKDFLKTKLSNTRYEYVDNRNLKVNMSDIVRLLSVYSDLLVAKNASATHQVDIPSNVVETINQLIYNLIHSEDSWNYDSFFVLLKDTAYGYEFRSYEKYKDIVSLFWYTWFVYNYGQITDRSYWEDIYNNDENQDMYSLMNDWRSYVDSGTNLGLVYGLYYYSIYSYLLSMSNFVDDMYSQNLEIQMQDCMKILINDGILSSKILHSPEELPHELANMYPTVELFQLDTYVRRHTSYESNTDINDILSDIGV